MQYINPIEILGLSNVDDTTNIDNEIVRKAKRKLFADIDLSDNGLFEYYGLQLTKGDCEKVIEELTNNDLKEFYLYLATNKKLNNFLVNGNNAVFINFKQDSIFKLPEFVKFISPYFAPKFDKALLNAFENEDVEQVKSILKTSFLISQSDINLAYKSVSNNIQNRLDEIAAIKRDIKNEESVYDEDNIDEVVDLVVENFPSEILNCLPTYFQSQILKIANEINYLNVVIWDNFDNTQVCNDLLEHVLTLNIGGLERPTFQKNYEIVRNKNQERIEQEKNAPILRKYAVYLIQTKIKLKELEDKTTTPESLLSWIKSSITIRDVNNLPSVFDEIKNQVALSLRAMSVEVWNSFSNIDISFDLICRANEINGLKTDTKNSLLEAKKQLADLRSKLEIASLGNQSSTLSRHPKGTAKSKDGDLGCIWGIILGIAFIFFWVNSTKSDEINYSPEVDKLASHAPTDSDSKDGPVFENKLTESKYKGKQLKNGASPLTGCFGKGIYSGNATLTIENGGNSDAIICLYSIEKDKTIRNEYVRKNSNFTMSQIAQGYYKIRVFYGNDWNPTIKNSCGTKGDFESDVHFSEFDQDQFFQDSYLGYSNVSVTLYEIQGGNATTSALDKDKFFSK